MYRSMPPRTITVSCTRNSPFEVRASASSNADARSQRMPPVQYMSTCLPFRRACVSGALIHLGNSRLLRILGSMSSAPPGGGWKWPIALSYALRTSMMTASGLRISLWYSSASTCRAVLVAIAGVISDGSP